MRSFKKTGKTVVTLLAVFGLIWGMDFVLYPCTFMRNDIHSVTSMQRDTVILGTSNGKMGIDPEALLEGTGETGHNLCVGGEYPIDAYYLTKLMIEKQNPRRIIFELDPGYLTTTKEVGNNYLLFYHEFPISLAKAEYFADAMLDTDFRNMLFPFYEYPLSYELEHASRTIYQKANQNYDVSYLKGKAQEYHDNGFIERYNVDAAEIRETTPVLFVEEKIQAVNMKYMDKLIRLCHENGIDFSVVIMPLPAVTLAKYPENYKAAWTYFRTYFSERDVTCYNFNVEYYKEVSHDMQSFTDYEGHMNGDSAREFSRIFGKILSDGGTYGAVIGNSGGN